MEKKFWQIRLYEYNKNITSEREKGGFDFLSNIPRVMLEDDVIIAIDRKQAKEIIIEKYGKHPFSLTKKNKVNGHKYFYLRESQQYYYDRIYKEENLVCEECGDDFTVYGSKNIVTKYSHIEKQVVNFCCFDCKDNYTKKEEKQGLGVWVSNDSHLESNIKGYIYRITNKHTKRSYIGQSKDVPIFRWWTHLGGGKECLKNKFEIDSITELFFEIAMIVYDGDGHDLRYYEQYFIDRYNSVEDGYNSRNEI